MRGANRDVIQNQRVPAPSGSQPHHKGRNRIDYIIVFENIIFKDCASFFPVLDLDSRNIIP